MRFIGRRPVKPLGLIKTPKEEFEMKQIQMLKDAAKGLVIGTALFYITPQVIEVIAHITAIK